MCPCIRKQCVLVCVSEMESTEPRAKRQKMEESFQLTEQQQSLIKEDQPNRKNWDEAMGHLKEGPVRKGHNATCHDATRHSTADAMATAQTASKRT